MLLLPAAITFADAIDAQRLLGQAMRGEAGPEIGVVVDATHLVRFDSSALAVLLECQRLAAGHGKSLSVRGAPAKLVTLAQLYGMQEVLSFAAPVAAATQPSLRAPRTSAGPTGTY